MTQTGSNSAPDRGGPERGTAGRCPTELARAARTVRATLVRMDVTLGDAYARALDAASEGHGGRSPVLLLALEAGRQVAWQGAALTRPRDNDPTSRVEIVTLRRFRAAGQEFEPTQRYRVSRRDLAELNWRQALEPRDALYRMSTNGHHS